MFDTLLTEYRALGLPLPPPDAPLVRWESTGMIMLAGGPPRPLWYLAFELPAAPGEAHPSLLVGTERYTPRAGKVVRVQPEAEAAEGIHGAWREGYFETNAALATAIQAKARGWDALAERLLALASKTAAGHHFSPFFQPEGTPPRQALAMLARAHLANELTEPGSDRASIAARFEASLAIGAPVRGHFEELLRSLHQTLQAPRAAPGSIEAKIDALCDMTAPRGSGDYPPAFLRVAELGFEAVPALLDHLGDKRLTRTVKPGFNNFPSYHQDLEEIVSDLLQAIAGEDLGKDWLRRQQGYPVEPAAARAWWTKAQAVGEEAYLTAHVLPAAADAQAPNRLALLILAHRHPRRLEDVYRAALDRPRMDTNANARAVASSALPEADRRRLLLAGAGHATLSHRFAALRALQPLDPEAYARLLTRALDTLPRSPEGAYWSAPEAAASRLASETGDPKVWAALLRAARRADVGLRMELVGTLDYTYLADRQRRERLAFLAAFLDDTAVPDVTKDPDKWSGPRAAFTLPGIAVRDLAGMKIASILGLPVTPEASWTPAQWEALRAQVKQALAAGAAARP